MPEIDWSSGLDVEKETIVATAPTEPFWAENLLFCPYDPKADIGAWLHLGSVPNDWGLWEDRVFITLPGDQGVLSMWGYYRTPQALKPGGSALFARCVEPFKRWKVTFDGFADHISNQAMMAGGLAPVSGKRRRVVIDLDIDALCPVWDAQSSAHSAEGKGDMASQGWAKEHYEQMYRATGTVRVDLQEWPFDGIGWRDHSRGPRGGGTGAPWGGHIIAGAVWPSGRTAIWSQYWSPDGTITLEGANVTETDGAVHSAVVVDAPRLRELIPRGETLTTRLSYAGREAEFKMSCDKSIWTSMQNQLTVGIDKGGPGLMYVLNYGEITWDGEVGHHYIERSDPLSLPPIVLKAPGR
jgi:hypothetical protein